MTSSLSKEYELVALVSNRDSDLPDMLRSALPGFSLVGSIDALEARLRKAHDGVVGVLLDLRQLPNQAEWGRLTLVVADPRIRCVSLVDPEGLEQPELFEIALHHSIDTLTAPLRIEDLAHVLDSLQRRLQLMVQARQRHPTLRVAANLGGMIGFGERMQRLFREIYKVAASDVSVFIHGETGTGKELTARALHDLSSRKDGPFIAINCGAIPPHLIQSELFGYEKGAFTGAHQRKIGRIELAHGGVLFLDEIGDLPQDSQVSLLRFLQEGRFERLGGTQSIGVDVRIISATHVDLERAQSDGMFRSDLFHRLCVVPLRVPPLRERGEDIRLLAQHVFDAHKHEGRKGLAGFSRGAVDAMQTYAWPGNVRELINRVRRAIVMCEGRRITADDLDLDEFSEADLLPRTLREIRALAEAQAIGESLGRHSDDLARAARELGVSRATLYRLIERHGVRGTGALRNGRGN